MVNIITPKECAVDVEVYIECFEKLFDTCIIWATMQDT